MFYIVIVVAALVAVYFIFGDNIKSLFAGNPLASEVKSVLDVNKDGQLGLADVKEAAVKVTKKVKDVETKVKASAKKMTGKKKK
jgi:hypothetical protein